MSTKYYYAAYAYAPDEVAIFADEKKRNAWVNCQDKMSRYFPPLDTDRIKLTAKDVYNIYSVDMYNKKRWNGDPNYSGVFWLIPSTNKKVRKEKMNKYARRAAESLYYSVHPQEKTETVKERMRREILEELGAKEYQVTLTETFDHDFTVIAMSAKDAENKARERYEMGEAMPDYEKDFSKMSIEVAI